MDEGSLHVGLPAIGFNEVMGAGEGSMAVVIVKGAQQMPQLVPDILREVVGPKGIVPYIWSIPSEKLNTPRLLPGSPITGDGLVQRGTIGYGGTTLRNSTCGAPPALEERTSIFSLRISITEWPCLDPPR
jgi:hypothetical protein